MKINTTKINTTKIPEEWGNFQINLIPPPHCEGCENNCTVLYDKHRDEYFSLNCGIVIMEQGQYMLPSTIEYTYNTTITHRRKRKKEEL